MTEVDDYQKELTSLKQNQESTRKDKNVMMSTHFKLIKSNERLSSELESCRKELKKHQ